MINNKLFFSTLIGLFLSLVGFAQNYTYHISGKLRNISPMPAKLYLKEVLPLGLLAKPLDSAEVKNGEYDFNGQLMVDEGVATVIASDIQAKNIDKISVILDKGELMITSNGQLKNSIVTGTGSSAHQRFEEVKAGGQKITDSLKAIMSSDAYKTDKELQQKVQSAAAKSAGNSLFNLYNYAKGHPEDRISPYITLALVAVPILKQVGKDTLVGLLPEKVKADKLGQAIIKMNNRNVAFSDSVIKVNQTKMIDELSKVPLGSQAAEIKQNSPEGKPISLSSLKGRYVLVDFWASWCGPCRAENPNVVKLYQQYKDKGFTVYGVSLDGASAKAAWIKAIAQDGLVWSQVSELTGWANTAAKAYDIKSIPQNFLVDPNGKIVAKNLRGESLAKELAAIFNK